MTNGFTRNIAKNIFMPADVLLPAGATLEVWSVIACDQFSSERGYWERVREIVNGEPSTLNMIIPEVYLGEIDEEKETEKILAVMDRYAERGLLREIKDSFVYVERVQPDGRVRRGLVGSVDLEEYDFSGNEAAIMASEGTILERLPMRVRIRRAARFELPHIMAFIDDNEATVIEPLAVKARKQELPLLYEFDLMEGGGHIRGMRITGRDADEVMAAIRSLNSKNRTLMVVGDGNHSLAAAKVCWDELKQSLSENEKESHPARYALLEVNNVYDPAITFEAIHRVVFDTEPAELINALKKSLPQGTDYMLKWITQSQKGAFGVSAGCIGDMLAMLQDFLDEYTNSTGCRIDYIHGTDAVETLVQGSQSQDPGKGLILGLILPAMDKSELFATVKTSGVFPKKSFSVGCTRDKRYYLECRAIKTAKN
jgi:uncharacterized protein (DUF1015 family)